jgi:hypothetical protein
VCKLGRLLTVAQIGAPLDPTRPPSSFDSS